MYQRPLALGIVQGVRAELNVQGTSVVAVLPGAVDTDISADFPLPKMSLAMLQAPHRPYGLENGEEEIYPEDMASGISQGACC